MPKLTKIPDELSRLRFMLDNRGKQLDNWEKFANGLQAKIRGLESELETYKVGSRIMSSIKGDLQGELVWARAEYLHTISENPECSAWNIDELSVDELQGYLEDAKQSLEWEGICLS